MDVQSVYTIHKIQGPELIQNGDFEDAYAHWTSDFNRGRNNNGPTSGGCSAQGWVAISSCSSLDGICDDYFEYNGSTSDGSILITDAYGTGANVIPTASCTSSNDNCLAQVLADHTSGTGFSVYIDPSDVSGKAYWKQTITVEAGKTYEFSAWIMVIEEDPNLEFRIDGTSLTGGINLDRLTGGSNGPDQWQQVSASWNSNTTSGSVVIELVNLTTACIGNDIRIDDISFTESIPAPVEWLHFEAIQQQQHMTVSWTTASELHAAYFALERSDGGGQFQEISRIPAQGTTQEISTYQYIDKGIPSGMQGLVYYRLRQVDIDDTFSYSKTIEMYFSFTDPIEWFTVYPIPAEKTLFIRFGQFLQQALDIHLFNSLGQRVFSSMHNTGLEEIPIQVAHLSEGIYYLRVQSPFQQKTLKVQIQP